MQPLSPEEDLNSPCRCLEGSDSKSPDSNGFSEARQPSQKLEISSKPALQNHLLLVTLGNQGSTVDSSLADEPN